MKKLCFQKDFMTPGKEGRERPLRRERKNLCRLSRNVLLPGLSLCLVLFSQGCSLALEELPTGPAGRPLCDGTLYFFRYA